MEGAPIIILMLLFFVLDGWAMFRKGGVTMMTIPEEVLTKIEVHCPLLAVLCAHVRSARTPWTVRHHEKALADAYLRLPPAFRGRALSPVETNALASCSIGEAYGTAFRKEV